LKQLEQPTQVYSRLQKRLRHKTARRRAVRYGLLAGNVLLFAAIAILVVRAQSNTSVGNLVSVAAGSSNNTAIDPLDQLSAADIAVNISQVTHLPEATAVTNQADSVNAELAITQNSDSLVAKPQIVASAFKSNKDIQMYIAKAGDTIASIAAKFSVTSDSIRWSNGLEANTVLPGQKLYIPPVNGIVYVVKRGDTPASLATAYGANKQLIIAYNDAELTGLKVGERIIIPNGTPGGDGGGSGSGGVSVASASVGGFPWGAGPIYGSNGYDYGFCTWYVASQISVPSNWGNASSWSYYASISGWTVSSSPSVGAIAQTPYAAGGEGHVAIVDAVNASGTMIKYRDMNGLAGWGAVGYSGWVSASTFPNYISH
jgi:LysM repeat protein